MTASAAVRESFRTQATACKELGSPFTARLLRLLADDLAPGTPLADHILNWPGDPTSRGDALALRLAAGLHALVLSQRDAGLAALYARPEGPKAELLQGLRAALHQHAAFLSDWLTSPSQTNEPRRSVVLIAAAHWLAARYHLPLVLSELGASAGVNLIWDAYGLDLPGLTLGPDTPALTLSPTWRGPLPPPSLPTVIARAGVDLNPLDPDRDRLRLLAYVWADQHDRRTRMEQALNAVARLRPQIDRADAVDWLQTRLATPQPARCTWSFTPSPGSISRPRHRRAARRC